MFNVQETMATIQTIKRVLTVAIRILKKIFTSQIPLKKNDKRKMILVKVDIIVVLYI